MSKICCASFDDTGDLAAIRGCLYVLDLLLGIPSHELGDVGVRLDHHGSHEV